MDTIFIVHTFISRDRKSLKGNEAFYTVKKTYKKGFIKRVICFGEDQDFIDKKIFKKPIPLNMFLGQAISKINKIHPGFPSRFINIKMFDTMASKYVVNADACHYYMGFNNCVKKANDLGMKKILQCTMIHPEYLIDVIKKEKKISGLGLDRKNHLMINEYKKTIKKTDYFISLSDFVRDTLLNKKIEEEKIINLPLAVDSELFHPGEKKDDVFRILFVGTISFFKGINYFLSALNSLKIKNYEVVLCGNIEPEFKKHINYYSKKIKLKTTGYVNPIEYYKKSSIFVFPSLIEGTSKVVFEAISCGLPTIMTNNGGKIVRDNKEGFVLSPREIKPLSDKIQYLYDNPSEVKRMGRNARKNAINYDWESFSDNFYKTYKKLSF